MTQQKNKARDRQRELMKEGHEQAIQLMFSCASEHGFLASVTDRTNYRRIWGRDGSIISVAALLTGQDKLIDTARQTLETLAEHQGPQGEIPSNVDVASGRISYGGTAGRVDADLWYLIACGQYWRRTGDDRFLDKMTKSLEKVRFLLGAWEYNTRGLLYVPLTGDWADEYVHSGYVLYDQLLYLQALRELAAIHHCCHGSRDHQLNEKITRLQHLIRANYWFSDGDSIPEDVYHEILYKKGRKAAHRSRGLYWFSFFSPTGYGYRFDAMANALVSLLQVSDEARSEAVDDYIDKHVKPRKVMMLPAFYPVITPKDDDWEELQMTFSYNFKNRPYEYHNGGLWPLVTAFYVADLARRGKRERAETFLNGIHQANRMEMDGRPWSFPEFVHGRDHTPQGMSHMGWSAAAAIIGQAALDGQTIFDPDPQECASNGDL